MRINLSTADAAELLKYLEGKPRLDVMRRRIESKLAAASGASDKLTVEELHAASAACYYRAGDADRTEAAILEAAGKKLMILHERTLEKSEEGRGNRV